MMGDDRHVRLIRLYEFGYVVPWDEIVAELEEDSVATDGGIEQIEDGFNRRLGPHKVPRIECKKCGAKHHYDAAIGEFIGHCRDCSGFLRRPTEAEHEQFTDFLVWNSQHLDTDRSDGGADHGGDGE